MYDSAYLEGMTFPEFLAGVSANAELWQAVTARVRLHAGAVHAVRSIPGRWRVLVLADDWCGDAVNMLPVVARLVDEAPNVELRIVGRDAYPALMDRHLTNGNRSIPVFILLDEAGVCRGWWAPRPTALQAWFETEGRRLPKEARYPELRRWYARDRGASTVREFTDLLRCGAARAVDGGQVAQPCPSLLAVA
jgi:hypothetical protein